MSDWISVEDQLPEFYTPVSCVHVCPYTGKKVVTAGVRHETLGFFVFNEDGEPDTELRVVTEWQALPEPPQ